MFINHQILTVIYFYILYGKVYTPSTPINGNGRIQRWVCFMWSYSSLYCTIWFPNIVHKLENFYNNYETFDLMSVCKVRPHLLTCAFMSAYFSLVYSFIDLRQRIDYYIILDSNVIPEKASTTPAIDLKINYELGKLCTIFQYIMIFLYMSWMYNIHVK